MSHKVHTNVQRIHDYVHIRCMSIFTSFARNTVFFPGAYKTEPLSQAWHVRPPGVHVFLPLCHASVSHSLLAPHLGKSGCSLHGKPALPLRASSSLSLPPPTAPQELPPPARLHAGLSTLRGACTPWLLRRGHRPQLQPLPLPQGRELPGQSGRSLPTPQSTATETQLNLKDHLPVPLQVPCQSRRLSP